MKKTLLLPLAIMLSLFSGCTQQTSVPAATAPQIQDEEETKSKTVDFLEKSGDLIKKEFFDIGEIKGPYSTRVIFQNIVMTNVVTQRQIGALRLETESPLSNGTDTFIGTLDSDELQACIQSVKYIRDNMFTQKASTYTECEYQSRDGVLIGAYSNLRNSSVSWELYVKPQKHISRSSIYLSMDKIDELISLLEKAQAQLKTAGIGS